jgi:hypothetical protein
MDCGAIRRASHQSVENVKFSHQMALADAADRWIARHLACVFCSEREQSDTRAPPGRCSRSFASGMAGTNYQDIMHHVPLAERVFHVKHSSPHA